MRILIVEDEKPIANLIDLNLSSCGYQCTSVYDGLAAADLLEENTFDLILLDIMLPGANGFELMDLIRPTGTPVIFITARGSVADRVQGLRAGADDYLVKPFNKDNLFKTLASAVKLVEKKYYTFHTNKEILRIPFNQILYFTSNKHYVEIHVECTDNGLHKKIYEQRINLSDLEKNLPDYFYRCHRTTIINLHKIISIYNCCITLTDGSMHPISKKYVSSIHNAILDL